MQQAQVGVLTALFTMISTGIRSATGVGDALSTSWNCFAELSAAGETYLRQVNQWFEELLPQRKLHRMHRMNLRILSHHLWSKAIRFDERSLGGQNFGVIWKERILRQRRWIQIYKFDIDGGGRCPGVETASINHRTQGLRVSHSSGLRQLRSSWKFLTQHLRPTEYLSLNLQGILAQSGGDLTE